jgi:hypothetical protein
LKIIILVDGQTDKLKTEALLREEEALANKKQE